MTTVIDHYSPTSITINLKDLPVLGDGFKIWFQISKMTTVLHLESNYGSKRLQFFVSVRWGKFSCGYVWSIERIILTARCGSGNDNGLGTFKIINIPFRLTFVRWVPAFSIYLSSYITIWEAWLHYFPCTSYLFPGRRIAAKADLSYQNSQAAMRRSNLKCSTEIHQIVKVAN